MRPTGVTILAIIAFCIGAFNLLLGLFVALLGTAIGAMGGPILAALGAFAGVIFLIFGGLYALAGFGLWTLKPWAWMLTVVVAAIAAILNLFQALAGEIVGGTFGLILNGAILYYMMQPHVKAAFGRV